MIPLTGADRLYSLTELLNNARDFLKQNKIMDIEEGAFDFEIEFLAAVLGEHPDFVRGALRVRR
jgi:hypothetical protein